MNKTIISLTAYLTFFLSSSQAQVAINPKLYGQNAWYITASPDPVSTALNFSSDFDLRLPDIVASGVKYMRIGGISPNFVPLYKFDGTLAITDITKLTHLIDDLRSDNIEPIIQVGFNPAWPTYPVFTGYTGLGNYTPGQQATIAANLVTAVNSYYAGLSLPPVLNWIIANEPDLAKGSAPTWPTTNPAGYGYDNTLLT